MVVVVILGDMIEISESLADMHVGLMPTMVNNQTGLVFGFDAWYQRAIDRTRWKPELII